MTETEEIKWANDILGYKTQSLVDIPKEVREGSELIRRAIGMRTENEWHDNVLEHLDKLAYEISQSVRLPVDFQAAKKWDNPKVAMPLSFYWRWGLWMDCMADVPEMIELLLQGSVGAAFDAARN